MPFNELLITLQTIKLMNNYTSVRRCCWSLFSFIYSYFNHIIL